MRHTDFDQPRREGVSEGTAAQAQDSCPELASAEASWEAFQRDYPQLLQAHCGQWVAYHGNRRLGFAATRMELHQECLRQGLPENELVICSIQPVVEDIPIGLPGFGSSSSPAEDQKVC